MKLTNEVLNEDESHKVTKEDYNPLNYKLIYKKEELSIKEENVIDEVVLNCFYNICKYYNI